MKTDTANADQTADTIHAKTTSGDAKGHFQNGVNLFYYALAIIVVLVALAMKVWGVVALAMVALALVPVVIFLMVYGTFN
jgi:Flp pilus assembly protein TadB